MTGSSKDPLRDINEAAFLGHLNTTLEDTSITIKQTHATMYNGQVTCISTVSTQITTASIPLNYGVMLCTKYDDGGNYVYVGNSEDVTTSTGFPLYAPTADNMLVDTPARTLFPIDNLNKIHAISGSGTTTLCYFAF